MRFLEALIASLGIMLFGWLSIPIVGSLAGVGITVQQGIVMSVYFFGIRLVWLYLLRLVFTRPKNTKLGQKS